MRRLVSLTLYRNRHELLLSLLFLAVMGVMQPGQGLVFLVALGV